MYKRRRYLGLQSFSIDESNLFFGREEPVYEVYRLLRLSQGQILTIYGKSGMGKTSLVHAGVVPLIQRDGVEFITIRTGAYTPSGISLSGKITRILRDWASMNHLDQTALDQWLIESCSSENIWIWLKIFQLHKPDHQLRLVLFFDQFEEVFTYPQAEIDGFARQLAIALDPRLPPELFDILDRQLPPFDDYQLEYLHTPFNTQFLLAIRSDRLSLLDRVRSRLPTVFRNIYELGPLNLDQARSSLTGPASLSDDNFSSPPFEYSDEALSALIEFLSHGEQGHIEPIQVQIFGQYAEDLATRTGKRLLTLSDFGSLELLYEDYYERSIINLPPEIQHQARLLIEDGLIFEAEQRRLSLYEGQIMSVWEITPENLRLLVDSRLLRIEPSSTGGYTYELAHDTLVRPALKSKYKRMQASQAEQMFNKQAQLQYHVGIESYKINKYRRTILLLLALCIALAIWITLLLAYH